MLKDLFRIGIVTLFLGCKNPSDQSKQNILSADISEVPHTLEDRANDLYQKEQYGKAKLCYDTLIRIDSTKGTYYFRRAYCKSRLPSDDQSVIADYLKSIEHDYEKKQSAYLNIGVEHRFRAVFRCFTVEAKKAEYDTALYFYNECLKIEPNNVKARQEKQEVVRNLKALK